LNKFALSNGLKIAEMCTSNEESIKKGGKLTQNYVHKRRRVEDVDSSRVDNFNFVKKFRRSLNWSQWYSEVVSNLSSLHIDHAYDSVWRASSHAFHF
jgi:hypothetical protein